MSAAAAEDRALDQAVASWTGLAGPAVDGEQLLHLAARAVGLPVGAVDAGALPLNTKP